VVTGEKMETPKWLGKTVCIEIKAGDKNSFKFNWQTKGKPYSDFPDSYNGNIGLLHGEASNTCCVDIDYPEKFEKMFGKISYYAYNTPTIKTSRGYHLIYKWQPELKNCTLPFGDFLYSKTSLLPPSTANGVLRQWVYKNRINTNPIEIPIEFVRLIKENTNSPPVPKLFQSHSFFSQTVTKKSSCLQIQENSYRNVFLTEMAGIVGHYVTADDLMEIMQVFNRYYCSPPLPYSEIIGMVRKRLDYKEETDLTVSEQILNLLSNNLEPMYYKTIAEILGQKVETTRKTCIRLVKDKQLLFHKKGRYSVINKPIFTKMKNIGADIGQPINFSLKYFDHVGYLCFGDIVLLGLKTGHGKTHIALNIARELLLQGVPTYYYYTEGGGRFKTVADKLGNCDNLNVAYAPEPGKITIPDRNCVVILDWLLVEDKAETDMVFKQLAETVLEKKALLVIFMQLKENGDWFAPNMVKQYPALVCKYLFDTDDRTKGHWIVEKVREPIGNVRKIPCLFNLTTAELSQY
jgi:hypothetical protein